MKDLESKLKEFAPKSESKLNEIFLDLAESFLYGGYISVKDQKYKERYRIYLRTVEFYCHHEDNDQDKKNSALPKDPIVYHRNGKYVEGEVPYFPLMAFHAHASGFDITFEKQELQLRSSALIRAYEVYDVQCGQFLTYNREHKKFVKCDENKKERVNSQSTYLYDFLNGFIGDSVKWVDTVLQEPKALKVAARKNVYLYDDKGGKSKDKDNRPWSFTREEEISQDALPKK